MKHLQRKQQKDLDKWEPFLDGLDRIFNMIMMSNFPKLIYKTVREKKKKKSYGFGGIQGLVLKFNWKNKQEYLNT